MSDCWQHLFSPGWNEPVGVITVAEQRGSSPRNPGVKMVVSMSETRGTIGGGNLEHLAIAEVRDRLADFSHSSIELIKLTLGKDLDQCCGGTVALVVELTQPSELNWADEVSSKVSAGYSVEITTDLGTGKKSIFAPEIRPKIWDRPASTASARLERSGGDHLLVEQHHPYRMDVVLFGAGHVGKALVEALSPLNCQVRWIDSRPTLFPLSVSDNILPCRTSDPVSEIEPSSPHTFFLIMTHSHSLDLKLVTAILDKTESRFVGLIGSNAKRRNFISKLKQSGICDSKLKRLVCPIGLDSIKDKSPSAIALGTAAQLQIAFERRAITLVHPSADDVKVGSIK